MEQPSKNCVYAKKILPVNALAATIVPIVHVFAAADVPAVKKITVVANKFQIVVHQEERFVAEVINATITVQTKKNANIVRKRKQKTNAIVAKAKINATKFFL